MRSQIHRALEKRRRPRVESPAGFTLIEILVVIAIVALLAALTIGALLTVPEHARTRGTEALIAKIDARLSQMLNEFNQRRDSIRTLDKAGVPGVSDVDLVLAANHPNRARVVALTR